MIRKVFSLLSKIVKIHNEIKRFKKKGKPWYKSKTIWVNVVAFLATFASFKGVNVTPEEQAQIVTGILAVVNILLRFVTHDPITIKKTPERLGDKDGE